MSTNLVRYLTVTRTRTKAEARKRRREELRGLRGQILALEEMVDVVTDAPLDLKWKEQIEVRPGDPGYEIADECYDPALYVGHFERLNLDSTTKEKA